MKIIKILLVSALFQFSLSAMPVRYSNEISFMRVMISSSELSINRVSGNEYSINNRYHLASSFVKGEYNQIIKQLKNFKSNDPVLLEYVKIGNGKKMVVNIAVP